MSRSRESRPRGSRKQQTKITNAVRVRTLNRLKKNYYGTQEFALLSSFSPGYFQMSHTTKTSNILFVFNSLITSFQSNKKS